MNDLPLSGCTPEPLMNYLKALGVFRLVAEAEEADPEATLAWTNGTASLRTRLNRDAILDFFLTQYRPTPILAPWNGGSGFYGGGSAPVEAISRSTSPRLQLYRETIQLVRSFVPSQKPKDTDKQRLLAQSRARLADEVVTWLDVCFVLGEESVRYFPLLGTGGNDGRLDFTNNFMQRLAEVLAFNDQEQEPKDSRALLASALFADVVVSLGSSAIGQFNPGGIGGANGTQGRFEAGSLVNAWDYVLMIEGTLLFAGALARRMGQSSRSRAVFPFSVDSVAVGYASATASEETSDGSRSELWLPLWTEPAALSEVRHLFAEGRAQLGRRQARNAVEFALSVNLLGISRGISSFTRYGFLKRNGLAFLASPLGRVNVQPRPQARLLDDSALTGWLDRWRRATSDKSRTPARYQAALRQIDRSMFEFACRSEHGNDSKWLVSVLRALGNAERTLATGLRFAQSEGIRPLQGLSPDWLEQADDGSAEFRLAAAVTGIGDVKNVTGPFRSYLEEVEFKGFYDWSPGSCSRVWSRRDVAANLAAVFQRRQLEAFRKNSDAKGVPLNASRLASLVDVIDFLNGDIDDEKLADLLWALTAIDWQSVKRELPSHRDDVVIPFEYGVARLLVEPLPLKPIRLKSRTTVWKLPEPQIAWPSANKSRGDSRKRGEANDPTVPDQSVFHEFASGRSDAVSRAVTLAARRLKSGGRLVSGYRSRLRAGKELAVLSSIKPERLLAAMLFPVPNFDLELIANSVLSPPELEE
ncbi:MAG: type I-U CRISPR-associated protein Csx17 [Planctomycetaceae bacterium]|nr:type I-U CRISPR-associated protein Csx17 [Planctomycetaceae bacterium]